MAPAQSSPGIRRLAPSLFTAIALLAIGTLALTQELRSRPDVVNSVRIKTIDDGTAATIRLRLTESESSATIAIIDRRGDVVAEPITAEPIGPGVVRTTWDGLVGAAPAPPGRYRVRFSLTELDREAFLPGKIKIEADR